MQLRTGTAFDVDAVLLDMDGTLVDSTEVVVRLWRSWAARHGVDPEAILAMSHGRRGDDVLAEFAPPGVDQVAELKWLAARELVERDGIFAVRGAASLLAALPADRYAVVTSATRELTAVRMQAASLPVPEVLVGADDVVRGKPDPEGYHRAADLLKVDPSRCLVIEDAAAGLEAGRAAGARVIAVATTLSGEMLDAWDWVPDLQAVRIGVDRARKGATRAARLHVTIGALLVALVASGGCTRGERAGPPSASGTRTASSQPTASGFVGGYDTWDALTFRHEEQSPPRTNAVIAAVRRSRLS